MQPRQRDPTPGKKMVQTPWESVVRSLDRYEEQVPTPERRESRTCTSTCAPMLMQLKWNHTEAHPLGSE